MCGRSVFWTKKWLLFPKRPIITSRIVLCLSQKVAWNPSQTVVSAEFYTCSSIYLGRKVIAEPQGNNERRQSLILPGATLMRFGKKRRSFDIRSTTLMPLPKTLDAQSSSENIDMATSSTQRKLPIKRERSPLQAPESMSRRKFTYANIDWS